MNKNYIKALNAIGKADAILYAIENCYLDFDIIPEEMERAERGTNAFYAAWDAVREARCALEKLEDDKHLVDVIRTVRKIKAESTLTEKD